MRAIDTTVGKLKIGAPLVMGKYGVNNDAPYPILWLKGTPNGDFITKDAVDFLPFDGPVSYTHLTLPTTRIV